jgi:hypothetical protein
MRFQERSRKKAACTFDPGSVRTVRGRNRRRKWRASPRIWVGVDAQDTLAHAIQVQREIDDGGRLADPPGRGKRTCEYA